jgi:uncharacterized membrane protein
MFQVILLVIVFLAALFYLGRFIYRQATADKDDANCEKCLPKKPDSD